MIQPPRGVKDLTESATAAYDAMLAHARRIAFLHGYKRIIPPIIEHAQTFEHTAGALSDVVLKEMYGLTHRSSSNKQYETSKNCVLRPEATASVARMYAHTRPLLPWKVWYHGSMFRYNRPQKGRFREFHQIGFEHLGIKDVWCVVDNIAACYAWIRHFAPHGTYNVIINHLGGNATQKQYVASLEAFFEDKPLSTISRERLGRNTLRILDSKEPEDQEWIMRAPTIDTCYNDEEKRHKKNIEEGLYAYNIPFVYQPHLVRGLDYYEHTVWEIISDHQAIAAGGCYSQLTTHFEQDPIPSVGWACGLERMRSLMKEIPDENNMRVGLVCDDDLYPHMIPVLCSLRQHHIPVLRAYKNSLKKQIHWCIKQSCSHILVYGTSEHNTSSVIIKNLANAQQTIIPQNDISAMVGLLRSKFAP